MNPRKAFAMALKELREVRNLAQEEFAVVSSRTYISMLERQERTPTLDKIGQIAQVLKVHPLTLLALCYSKVAGEEPETLLNRVAKETRRLRKLKPAVPKRTVRLR